MISQMVGDNKIMRKKKRRMPEILSSGSIVIIM